MNAFLDLPLPLRPLIISFIMSTLKELSLIMCPISFPLFDLTIDNYSPLLIFEEISALFFLVQLYLILIFFTFPLLLTFKFILHC